MGQYSEDTMREMRTMIMLCLPYPPLPVLAARIEDGDGRLQEDDVTTSHTFIAKGLQDSMLRNDQALNGQRLQRQQRVLQEFLHAMATEGFHCDPERLYLIYCRFTLEHIATYFPPGHPLDIRFKPLSYIVKGDRSHLKLAEFLAGQSILHEDPAPISRSQYLHYEPIELFNAVRDRLGHIASEEELARARIMEKKIE
jgi:hypothetical protein